MAESAIDPKAIPGVVESLGIVGVASLPPAVSLDDVHFVYDLGAGGFARLSQNSSGVLDTSIVGVATYRGNILGPKGSLYFTAAPLNTYDLPSNARIIAFELVLGFNAAGALAFNGKTVKLTCKLLESLAVNTIGLFTPVDTVIATATTAYKFYPLNLASAWKQMLLSGLNLVCDFQSLDATVFPASTTVQVNLCWMTRKLGGQLPS